jgi:hypothetical protein
MCAPGAIPEYDTGSEHGAGTPLSIEQASDDALAAEKENEVDVDDVVAPGPDVIVTDGAAGGGADVAATTVHVTTACAEPLALATRTANVLAPGERPVSVSGDVQVWAGCPAPAQVVVVAPCDVHANVAVVADVVAGGCWVRVMVGSAAEDDAAAGIGSAGAPPARMPPIATAAAEAARKRARDI